MTALSKAPFSLTSVRVVYLFTLVLYFSASFFPDLRVWGVGAWAFHPLTTRAVFMGIGIAILLIEWTFLFHKGYLSDIPTNTQRSFLPFAIFILTLFGVLFYLLQAKTHFLGDGYTLLAELAKENPLVKSRGLGEGLLHLWVKNLVGVGESAALAAYQIISVGAGLVFVAITTVGSRLLFTRLIERLLFALGILSGGYLLLFFGYVENYSLFAVSLLSFLLIGLLICQGKANRWWILIPLSLAIFFHLLGAFLVPAAALLLVQGRRYWERFLKLSFGQRAALATIPLLAGLLAFGYLRANSIYFRFAFVPLTPDRFTVGSYTLLSISHLGDVINLLLLTSPGLMMIFFLFHKKQVATVQIRHARSFLLLAVAGSLLAVSILDPKLGMPRDWDLFSFVGIPITVFLFWTLLTSGSKNSARFSIAVLAIGLGWLTLAPRVLMQTDPAVSVPTFSSYLHLDPQRSRTGMFLLATHYLQMGDTANAISVETERRSMFPEERFMMQAKQAGADGRLQESKSLTLMALQQNAGYADAWLGLAGCYDAEQKWDSALMAAQIADGLNPYNFVILNQMALAYLGKKQTDKAVVIWQELEARDTTLYQPAHNLSRIARSNGDMALYEQQMKRAASRTAAPVGVVKELADFYLRRGLLNEAALQYEHAIRKGLDSTVMTEMLNKNPQLRSIMQPGAK